MNESNTELHHDLRSAVSELCGRFSDTYWRDLDRVDAYPEEFVKTLTDAGYLSALIPEEYGGSGLGIREASIILEEVNHSGGMPQRATRRCTSWGRCCVMGRTRKNRSIFLKSPAENCDFKHSV